MKVIVNTKDLLSTVLENRAAHRDIFERALERYRAKLIEEFEARIARIKAGKDFDVFVRLPQPEDHTDDYDRVIAMLEMHTEDTIELSEADVAQYVQDNWQWTKAWAGSTAAYVSE